MISQGYVRHEGGIRMRKGAQERKSLISVITAVYNGAQYIEQAIQSVLNQSFDNFEYLVVDGGSTDGTIDIIRQFDDRIDYWISEPDNGIYDAWNKGILAAKGEWIAFLGSDDLYYDDALSRYAQYVGDRQGETLEYASSRVDFVTPDLELIKVIGIPWEWKRFRKGMKVAHVGSLHHRRLFERYGLYNTDYKIVGDYELLLRARENLRAGFIDTITAMMRNGGTSNNMVRAFSEAKQAKNRSGGRNPMLCTLDNVVDMTKITLKQFFLKRYCC